MEDKRNILDQIIRAKMAGLAPSYRPETWEQLSDKLDAAAAAGWSADEALSEAQPFDHIIREKMEALNPEYYEHNWELMSERLDQLEEGTPAGAGTEAMDEVIFARMHRFNTPYQPSHWELMLQRLQAETVLVHRLLRYKAMELSLLALLLLTFVRMPVPPSEAPAQLAPPVQVTPRPQAQAIPDQEKAAAIASTTELAEAAQTIAADQQLAQQDAATVSAESSQSKTTTAATNTPSLPKSVPAFDPSRFLTPGVQNLNQLPREIPNPAAPARNYALPKPPIAQADLGEKIHSGPAINLGQPNALGVLSYLPVGMIKPLCQSCWLGLDQQARKSHKSLFFRIGMQGGPEYNRIITPATEIDGNTYEDDRYALGYSGGLSLGLEIGRWEIETGLIYTNKRYFPLPVVVLQGSVSGGFFGDGTKQFDLDVFQVPLNLRYDVLRKNRWRIYGLAGMSLQITGQSNYYLANPDGFQTQNYRPLPIRPSTENPGRKAASVRSQFDNFTKGWLEGGSFNKNSYLSANMGVGIERFITDYWSIYAQPTYRHSLYYFNDGLGPFYDRIQTNSLLFGIKVRLR